MTPRAAPMPPEDRRGAIITATLPLLIEYGRGVTTRQIAVAAGVAEGTIFRVFESKDALLDEAIAQALDLEDYIVDLGTIDPALPLRERLIELVTRQQVRLTGVFRLISAMGLMRPPEDCPRHLEQQRRVERSTLALVEPDAEQLTLEPWRVVHLLRLLTFSGSHPHISEGEYLTPELIVSTVLDGVLKPGFQSQETR